MKRLGKGILCLVLLILLSVVVMISYAFIKDYDPEEVVSLDVKNNVDKKININDEISLLTFNIGFGALDKDMDFFMDGGKKSVGASKEKVEENIREMTDFIKKQDSDFILLQEVDKYATRSYYVNQYDYIKKSLPTYSSNFATNFNVQWIPVPVLEPHGRVLSGLASFSKYSIDESKRFKLPGKYSFIQQLFMLDRCFTENRLKLENGKELIVVNIHLSAYDKGGTIRKQQVEYLKSYLENEHKQGNYIIVGGDWNHIICTDVGNHCNISEVFNVVPDILNEQGFEWAVDESTYTCRYLDKPYIKGESEAVEIDGFLVSPNIDIVETQTHDLNFQHSDHNPVTLRVKLKK